MYVVCTLLQISHLLVFTGLTAVELQNTERDSVLGYWPQYKHCLASHECCTKKVTLVECTIDGYIDYSSQCCSVLALENVGGM